MLSRLFRISRIVPRSLVAALTAVLLAQSAAALSPPVIDNRYGLIPQTELPERYRREVEPFWSKVGQGGTFTSSVGGLRIAYMTFVNPQEKAAIVISSGRTESYVKYKELVFDLYRLGYSVYIHDHRGQGFSQRLLDDPQKGHVEHFDDYVADLDQFVREVVKKQPHRKLLLLAHSMGGAIATRYVELHPEVFDAAALSSPMHAPNAKILVSADTSCAWFKTSAKLCRDCYAGLKARPYSPQPYEGNEYTWSAERYTIFRNAYQQDTLVQLGGPTRQWVAEACAASQMMVQEAGRIRRPVLVLQAGQDTAVMPEAQNEFCAALQKSTGQGCWRNGPIRFEGARHELFIETDVFRVPALNAILDFYAEQLRK